MLPTIVHTLAELAEPWRDAYSNSAGLEITVMFAHLAGLLVGGGFAIAADRMTLRALRGDPADRLRQLGELNAVHRPIVISLAVLVLSGLLLAAADVETFAVSRPFWVKMGLIVLLLINGAVLYRTERRLRGAMMAGEIPPATAWQWLRRTSVASLVLWLLIVLVGTVLSVAA